MNRIPNKSSLLYERNIMNMKNIYPIRSDTSVLNPQILYNTSTNEVTYNPLTANNTYSISSSTYTMPSASSVLFANASSNAITITLPTAIGISGVNYKIIRIDTTLANAITINTTNSQTIGGSSSKKMYTANEVWHIVSDGANWRVINHVATTSYIDAGSQTIGGIPDPPGVGTTSYNKLQWKRDGKDIHILFGFNATSTPSTGTGDYLFTLVPSGITIDTTILGTYTIGEATGTYQVLAAIGLGKCTVSNATNSGIGLLVPYSSTQVRLFIPTIVYTPFTSTSAYTCVVGSGANAYPVTNGTNYNISCIIPITEFEQ